MTSVDREPAVDFSTAADRAQEFRLAEDVAAAEQLYHQILDGGNLAVGYAEHHLGVCARHRAHLVGDDPVRGTLLRQSVEYFNRAQRAYALAGDRVRMSATSLDKGLSYFALGMHPEAACVIAESIVTLEEHPEKDSFVVEHLAIKHARYAEVLLAMGKVDDAQTHLRTARGLQSCIPGRNRHFEIVTSVVEGKVLLRCGDPQKAIRVWSKARKDAQMLGDLHRMAEIDALLEHAS